MTTLRVLASRLLAILPGRDRDAALNDEVQAHLDTLTEDHVRRGLSPEAARAAARREFGGVEQMKETYREQRGLPFVETFHQDLRYALRALRASPGFAAAAILSLALGIGANSAVFSVVDAALIRDLPVEDPDQLATVYWRDTVAGARNGQNPGAASSDFSYPVFQELATRQRVFSDMAASGNWRLNRIKLDGAADDESAADIDAGIVSANYFSMLGVRASVGRVFTADDSRVPGEGAVAVMGDGFWTRRFGRDPSVLGRTIVLNSVPFTIIGVMPRGFFGDRVGVSRDFWVPILMQPRLGPSNQLERRTATWFRTMGRLKPGVTDAQARTELTALFRQSLADEIASGTGTRVGRVNPANAQVEIARGSQALNTLRARVEQPLMVLMGVAGLVLLIACCNVANLLLARASARQREIGIRLAMGSSRVRLIGQLMTESLLLAVVGGIAGQMVSQATSGLLARTLSIGVLDLRPDSSVVMFTLLASMATTVVFGLVPALQGTRVDIAPTLQSAPATISGVRPRLRIGKALVVAQVGLTLWVLIAAGLLVRTLQNMRTVEIGIDRTHVMTVTPLVDPGARADVPSLRRALIARLNTLPGVESVGFSTGFGLFLGSMTTAPVRVPDSTVNPQTDRDVSQDWISPEYFRTVGMTLVRGRAFHESDSETAPRVTIINETTARHYFGDQNPVGRIIYFPKIDAQSRYLPFARQPSRADGTEIVGVVRDAKDFSLRQPPRKMAFLPISQQWSGTATVGYGNVGTLGTIHLRVLANRNDVALQVAGLLKQIHPGIGVRRISMLDADIERTTMGRELMMTRLVGVFGLLALLLACVGLFGVMAYTVARRTGEIGLRMALGARQTDVAGMILRETAGLVIGGIVLGIPAALVTTRLLEGLLFGLEPTDPATIAVVTLLMLAVSAAAGLLPARRAAKVDPMVALRHQ